MADDKDLYLPDNLYDPDEPYQECFSPTCESSIPARKCFSLPTIDCASSSNFDFLPCESTPKISNKVFLSQFNDNKLRAMLKREFEEEDKNEFFENNVHAFGQMTSEEVDFTPPRYRNNVSPAIEKLIRMMNTPSVSIDQIPKQIVYSPSFIGNKMFNDDSVILSKQCVDTSCSPQTPSRKHNLCNSMLKMTLSKDVDLSLPQAVQESLLPEDASQKFTDALLVEKEPVKNSSNCEVKA